MLADAGQGQHGKRLKILSNTKWVLVCATAYSSFRVDVSSYELFLGRTFVHQSTNMNDLRDLVNGRDDQVKGECEETEVDLNVLEGLI